MFKRILVQFGLPLLAVLLVASPVLAYLFSALVTVQETNGTAYTMIGVQDTLDADWLIDHGMMAANALDTVISPTKPHMVAFDRLLTATSLPAFGQVNVNFTTGNTPAATSMDIITGYNGYVALNDVATLEPANNFQFDIADAYVDTSVAGNILLKSGAFELVSDGAGNLDASIIVEAYTDPTGFVDGSGNWNTEAQAYDNNLGTDANQLAVANASWSDFLELTIGATDIFGIRHYSFQNAGTYLIDVDVYYSAAWQDLYLGTFVNATWTPLYIGSTQSITAARVRYYNDSGAPASVRLYEFDFLTGASTTASTAVASGVHDVSVTATGGGTNLLGIAIDGGAPVTVALAGASVSDNTNDWILMSNISPYWGDYSHTVSGTLIGHYAPVTIIRGEAYSTGTVTVTNGDATVTGAGGATWTEDMVGSVFVSADGLYYTIASFTNATEIELSAVYAGGTLGGQTYNFYPRLPDREGAAQDGAITWGANPAGTAMSIASMSAYTGSFTDTDDDAPLDRLPEVPASDWYGDNTITKAATLANPLRGMVTMVSDNTPLTEIQTWRWYGVIILVAAGAVIGKVVRGHQGITAIALGAVLALLIAFDSSIFPLYLAVVSAGAIIGGLISERSHQI